MKVHCTFVKGGTRSVFFKGKEVACVKNIECQQHAIKVHLLLEKLYTAFCHVQCQGKTVFAQFPKAWSIQRWFSN
jgi:hypothetical protein